MKNAFGRLCIFFLPLCHCVVRTPRSVLYSYGIVRSQKGVQNTCRPTGAMIERYSGLLGKQSALTQTQNVNLISDLIRGSVQKVSGLANFLR